MLFQPRISRTLWGSARGISITTSSGNIQSEEYPGQYEQIVQAMVLVCVYWIPHSRLEEGMEMNGDFPGCVWGILYPLLTYKGKIQYRALKNIIP